MRVKLRRLWTPEDDALLREYAKSMSPQRAALRLERTLTATKIRAAALNIKFEIKQQRLKFSQRASGSFIYTRATAART